MRHVEAQRVVWEIKKKYARKRARIFGEAYVRVELPAPKEVKP